MSKRTAALLVTSRTGNTNMIADEMEAVLREHGWDVIRKENEEAAETVEADLYLLGYWVRRSGLNDQAQEILDLYRDKPIMTFGTMGSYATGAYADLVRENTVNAVEENNICKSTFLCQGKIPVERTERRRSLPPTAPHYLNDEGYKRHLESRKHPNEEDRAAARAWLTQELTQELTHELTHDMTHAPENA